MQIARGGAPPEPRCGSEPLVCSRNCPEVEVPGGRGGWGGWRLGVGDGGGVRLGLWPLEGCWLLL